MEEDKRVSIGLRQSTKDRLDVYRKHEGTYERAIIMLMDFFEKK